MVNACGDIVVHQSVYLDAIDLNRLEADRRQQNDDGVNMFAGYADLDHVETGAAVLFPTNIAETTSTLNYK